MSGRLPSPAARSTALAEGGLGGRVGRYAAGSGVATVCSQVTFLVAYGPLGVGPAASSVAGWAAGVVPNYWLNRSWTWRRTGRPSVVHELVPYIAIVVVTLLLATAATSVADDVLDGTEVYDGVRVVVVGASFLGVYGVMFLVRFFLFDRLFRRLDDLAPPDGDSAVPAQEGA